MADYVYVARGARSGLIKIGISHSPASRALQLASRVREPIELVAVFRGTLKDERRLLQQTEAHAVERCGSREWRSPHADVEAVLAMLPETCRMSLTLAPRFRSTVRNRRPPEVTRAEREARQAQWRQQFVERHGHDPFRRAEECAACAAHALAVRTRKQRPSRFLAATTIVSRHVTYGFHNFVINCAYKRC
jgi:hypothetical protein